MSDRHIRLLRQAAKAARIRLTAFVEQPPAAETREDEVARAREVRTLRRRASNTEGQLRDAERRRHSVPTASDPPRDRGATPAAPTPVPLQRGSDGVLRPPPR